MFVLSRNVSASYRVIATLVAAALIMWALGLHSFAQAANVTHLYDLLSDSAPNSGSNHEISFVAPTSGVQGGETITVTFPAGFDLSTNSVDEGDIDLEVNGVDETVAATPSGTTWGASIAGQVLTIESGTDTIGNTATITIKIGTNADGGTNQIVNPGTGSYEIDIAGTMADSGHLRVAIVDTVAVTATVNTTFEFTVSGTATTTAVNGATTTITSSTTTIPFGVLNADDPEILAQDLTVTTNAIHGFVVTVEEDQHLLSSTGADIDNFVEGVTSDTPVAWASPVDVISDENTWGHWGITTEDFDTEGARTNEFSAGTWAGVSTTPQVVFAHNGPSDGTTPGQGATTIGYQVEISALQEAADDYSTTLTYIATPTF